MADFHGVTHQQVWTKTMGAEEFAICAYWTPPLSELDLHEVGSASSMEQSACLFFTAASSCESKWFDEGRAQKNSCGGGFGNFKLLFGNVGANLAKD